MRVFCALLAVLAWLMAAPASAAPGEALEQVDLELVLAVDVSGSVDFEEARLQRDGYVQAFLHPDVLKAILGGPNGKIAVTYFEWSEQSLANRVIDWRLIDSEQSARAFAGALGSARISRGRYTSISSAIDFAMPLFDDNAYDSVRRVIDISGDGPNNSGRLVNAARDAAVARGLTINGLPIVNTKPDRFGMPMPDLDLYYRDCVIGGPGAFYIVADDFGSFAAAVRRKLILEIAGLSPPRPLLQRVSDRVGPPCDTGERMLRERFGGSRF